MTPALAISAALLSLPATQVQPAGVPAFQPRLHVAFQTVVSRPSQKDGDREIVCGLAVIHKTPADDPKMVLPKRDQGAAVRRLEPQACGTKSVAAK
jgi:hypothetical protein